jgi:hypothetical protein
MKFARGGYKLGLLRMCSSSAHTVVWLTFYSPTREGLTYSIPHNLRTTKLHNVG